MSTNLHELTKQLDVLTYNSRSVLNALIRSVMAAGSSSGWTVKRANTPITLSRADIFMLSSFYTEWEYSKFNSDKFNELIETMDAQFSGKEGLSLTPVTDAVVKHSQIMNMTSYNAGESPAYWLALVRDSVNPKLFTNTAPIPVNIRTPIYDENLSTKHFDQFETYLFPRGYYSMDILGASGDDTVHNGGGLEWLFDVDDKFTVDASRVVFGIQNKEVAEKREQNYLVYGKQRSFAGGVDSYAFGYNSFAYGDHNQSLGKNSVTIGGSYDFAYGTNNGVLAGNRNYTVLENGAIGGGSYNTVSGQSGFAANEYNSVGGYTFPFVRYKSVPNSGAETECAPTYEPGDGCVYVLQSTTPADPSGSISSNQIMITIEDMVQAGFGHFNSATGQYEVKPNYISYASNTYDGNPAKPSYGDFKIGDTVCIFRAVVLGDDSGTSNIGSVLERTITNIELRDAGIVITFDSAVNTVPGYEGEVASGMVVKKFTYQMPLLNYGGEFDSYQDNYGAFGASTFGFNNIAAGPYQMSIGTSNAELLRPLFIIGNGSNYINAHTFRHNAMVVAPNYSYMATTSHYVFFGISDVTTATHYVHGTSMYDQYRVNDEDYVNYGIEKYKGVYAYSTYEDGADSNRAVLRVCPEYSTLSIGYTGIIMHPISTESHPNTDDVRLNATCAYGALSINSGSWVDDPNLPSIPELDQGSIEDNWVRFYADRVKNNTASGDRSISIWAHGTVGIHGTGTETNAGILMHTSHYIQAEYGTLSLLGNSIGALCASTESSKGIMDFKLGSPSAPQDPRFILNPGHYMVDNYPLDPDYTNCMTWHVVSNARLLQHDATTNADIYSSAKLIIPGNVQCNATGRVNGTLPHIRVKSQNISWNSDNTFSVTDPTKYLDEQLAYMSDVERIDRGYTGTPTYSVQLPATGTIYRHICRVKFDGQSQAVAGAMFAIAWRDSDTLSTGGQETYGISGGEGILSVSMSTVSPTVKHARVFVLNNRLPYVNVAKSTNFDILIRINHELSPNEYSFEIFTSAKEDTIYLASLRMMCGACSITYNEYDQTTVPAYIEAAEWTTNTISH